MVTPLWKVVNGHGGLLASESQLPQKGTRVAPQMFTDVRTRGDGLDRRNVAWSPENILVDTVARLQQDLADIRAESRQFSTPGVPPVVQTPRQAAFTTTKVPWFGGTTNWEQYRDRLADYRRQFDKTTRSAGEDPSIFAIALETLAVKAFGDMGQTVRLRLIRDRFIAGHSSCELRRYLDSVPPETPIRNVVDRCRV